MIEYDHYLRAKAIPGSAWQKVSKADWIRAERGAGFRPKLWSGDPEYMNTYATGGFFGSAVEGTLRRVGDAPPSD